MVDDDSPDSHSTDLIISGKEGHWTIYWLITCFGLKWGQIYFATLVTTQNCTKMLRNLTFVVQFAYFSTRPKKGFVFPSKFWAAFVIKSIFWFFLATFELFFFFKKLKETFLENLEQLVENPNQGYRARIELKN